MFASALAPLVARAQTASSDDESAERVKLERRRQDLTLAGHLFVAPLALRSVPFEFAIPLAQLASYTQLGYARVVGDRNIDQGPNTTHYALVAQTYHLSVRVGRRVEISVAPIGEAAAGLDGNSIITGGASAAGGSNLALAYRLVPFDRIAITLRAGGHFEFGYRANIEPLVYQAATNPLALVQGVDAARIGTPTRELGASLGLSGAYAISPRFSMQAFLRLDAISTQLSPFLERQGTQAAGARELVYEAWNPSFGASFGAYLGDELMIQPQLGVARHSSTLTSPEQDRGPYAKDWYLVPAVQLAFLPSPVLQLGIGAGCEIAWSDLEDNYQNRLSTQTFSAFLQLVARYVWGQEWPGH